MKVSTKYYTMENNPSYGIVQDGHPVIAGYALFEQQADRRRKKPHVSVAVVAITLTQTPSTFDLRSEMKNLQTTIENDLETLRDGSAYIGTPFNPANSCKEIPQGSQSGVYWVQTNSSNFPFRVYCDTNRKRCSCRNATGGWMRVANLDMTDPSQQCPDGFRQVTRTTVPLRTCGRPGPRGCVSTTFSTHGIEYSRVCGRVIGYQDSTPDAFHPYYSNNLTIDDTYVDGVSLTHGQSLRQHIWTFANAANEIRSNYCPCINPGQPFTGEIPPFVGQDYFCDTGSRQGCEGTSTCCEFNNPPWFCKQLPQSTTDDIELRLCASNVVENEDSPLEIVQIYIQ